VVHEKAEKECRSFIFESPTLVSPLAAVLRLPPLNSQRSVSHAGQMSLQNASALACARQGAGTLTVRAG
jgi:hypothetical protein